MLQLKSEYRTNRESTELNFTQTKDLKERSTPTLVR